MHTNQKYCEYCVKTLNGVVITWEVGTIYKYRRKIMWYGSRGYSKNPFGKSKRGVWNIFDNPMMSLKTCIDDRCTLACILILHPELKEAIIFSLKMVQKRFFCRKTIFNGNICFSCSFSPLSGDKSWQWPKVNYWAVK